MKVKVFIDGGLSFSLVPLDGDMFLLLGEKGSDRRIGYYSRAQLCEMFGREI